MMYGKLPVDLGLIDLNPTEMMFWMYCPISKPGNSYLNLPDNLHQYWPIIDRIDRDLFNNFGKQYIIESYIYITAKTLYVTPDNPGNRPGWHSDGFRTNDINYIWYDRAPTEFLDTCFYIPDYAGCEESYSLMNKAAYEYINYRSNSGNYIKYPNKHLLRLDQTVIHRVPLYFDPGMRTFVKISVSKDKYDLVGNSINHKLNTNFTYRARKDIRNHPASVRNL